MSLFCRLSRRHYWCTPHRSIDNRLVQVCYECGAERPVPELHHDVDLARQLRSLPGIQAESRRKAVPRVVSQPAASEAYEQERIAVGEGRPRFLLVK
jgi:hypothetical protein